MIDLQAARRDAEATLEDHKQRPGGRDPECPLCAAAELALALIDQVENRTAHKLGYIENGTLTRKGIKHLRSVLPEGWELVETSEHEITLHSGAKREASAP